MAVLVTTPTFDQITATSVRLTTTVSGVVDDQGGVIYLWGTSPSDYTSAPEAVVNPWLNGTHSVVVTDLPPGTTLYFIVASFGGDDLEVSGEASVTTLAPPAPAAAVTVSEHPPLRESIVVTSPSGRKYRWGEDAWTASDAPDSVVHGSTAPGGFSELTALLPRRYEDAYHDLDPLSEIEVLDAAGATVWEGYLERAARSSGDYIEVTPGAVGWQKALEDVSTINWLGIDPDLNKWEGMSSQRKLNSLGSWRAFGDPQVTQNETDLPALQLSFDAGAAYPLGEAWYRAPAGTAVGSFVYDMISRSTSDWTCVVNGSVDDVAANSVTVLGDMLTGTNSSANGEASVSPPRPYLRVSFFNNTLANLTGDSRMVIFRKAIPVGSHGLTVYPSSQTGYPGLLASDVIKLLVQTFAPELNVLDYNILPTDLPIPQSIGEATNLPSLIEEHNRFHLWDWAVWEGKQFYYQPQGQAPVHRTWKARVGPSQLEETGRDTRRVWNGAFVRFTDSSGRARVIGPPGTRADYNSELLVDKDPANPANIAGRTLYGTVDMRGISEPEPAATVGQRWIQSMKEADRSGQAKIAGYVQSASGRWFPHTSVRAGDRIEFVDASDPSPRRVAEVRHNRAERTSDVTLDAPSDSMEAVLDRLQLSLVGTGL